VKILVVDDEANLRRMLRALLEAEGYRVTEAERAEAALEEVEETPPEVVLLDLALPGMSGLEALPQILDVAPGLPVIMMSGQASLADAVEATRHGAFHFLEKPLTPEAVLVTVRGALEVSRARDLSRALQKEIGPDAQLVGESSAMERVRNQIQKVGPSDARVLLTGESGTGKELAAAAIHGISDRRGGPFVRVNSAAIPSELVESEMFGHERGAFSGATRRRRGRFELAHKGTLFLDEVADLDHRAQAKLLRALESGVIERVGGSEPIEVDVRIIAATNRDLRAEVEAGRFREDLLFRLEVIPIHIPPLRERPEDIPLLLDHARERMRRHRGLTPVRFDEEAVEALTSYPWPGNVRELLNLVERFTILHGGQEIGIADVRSVVEESGGGSDGDTGNEAYEDEDDRDLRQRLDDYEQALIEGALQAAEGNVAEASRRLQTDRGNLYRRMKRLGVSQDDQRDG